MPKKVTFLYSALGIESGYPFTSLFDIVHMVKEPDDLLSPNGALIVWGGEDISPALYGSTPSRRSSAFGSPSKRDNAEIALMHKAKAMNIPIIGICRGAQLLCALAGGSLIQHVTGHIGPHKIKTNNGDIVETTSLHHQMMFPWSIPNEKYKLIAWTWPLKSTQYFGEYDEENDRDKDLIFPEEELIKISSNLNVVSEEEIIEPEVIFFKDWKGLAIQGHPEFIFEKKHPFIAYTQHLVEDYVKSYIT